MENAIKKPITTDITCKIILTVLIAIGQIFQVFNIVDYLLDLVTKGNFNITISDAVEIGFIVVSLVMAIVLLVLLFTNKLSSVNLGKIMLVNSFFSLLSVVNSAVVVSSNIAYPGTVIRYVLVNLVFIAINLVFVFFVCFSNKVRLPLVIAILVFLGIRTIANIANYISVMAQTSSSEVLRALLISRISEVVGLIVFIFEAILVCKVKTKNLDN